MLSLSDNYSLFEFTFVPLQNLLSGSSCGSNDWDITQNYGQEHAVKS